METLAVYEPFRAQLAELKEHNALVVFDYEDPKGNKDARSYIYRLRKTKTAVDSARKEAGRGAMEYKRKVDAQGKEIIGEIEAMIQVHTDPIEAIEQREQQRVSDLTARVKHIQDFAQCEGMSAAGIAVQIDNLEAIAIDESFQEFQQDATQAKAESLARLQEALARQRTREAEQAELERLRQEARERERKDHEAKIAAEAEERAKREAEQKAQAEREAAQRREQALKQQAEQAQREAAEAEARVRREAEEQAAREQQERERREADRAHRGRVNASARDDLISGGLTPDQAELAVVLIAKSSVSNVHISY